MAEPSKKKIILIITFHILQARLLNKYNIYKVYLHNPLHKLIHDTTELLNDTKQTKTDKDTGESGHLAIYLNQAFNTQLNCCENVVK